MLRRRSELGEGQFGCIIGLIIFVAVIFLAWKMIPIKVKASELRGEVFNEAKSAGQHDDVHIRKALLFKAQELDLPVTDNDIKISRHANEITVNVQYTVPVKYPGFVYQWHFEHEAQNPIF